MRTRNQLNGDDNAGVLLCESYAGGPLNGLTVTNAYDERLRRTNVTILDPQSAILAATAYAYDQTSGRLHGVSQGGASAINSYVANSQLVGQIDFAKDSSPVMTTTKQFDSLNRLTQISSAPSASSAVASDYAYNTSSQRTAITNADNTRWDFQSDIQSLTLGMDLSGSLQGAGGVGGLLAVQVGPSAPGELANTLHFACNDGNGNIAALVNAADGTESARYDYGPFGEVLRATGPMAEVNPIRFSTQYADDVSGDVKYLYRDYTPRMGRWLSRDPIGERGGANLYSFVRNSPCNMFDAKGLMPLSHLGSGFQFVPGKNEFWLCLYSTFDENDYKAVGGIIGQSDVQAYVVSRAKLTWHIKPCCDTKDYSGSARGFFLDEFVLKENGSILGAGMGRALPRMTDGLSDLYFNPINTIATELRRCSDAGKGDNIEVTGRTEGVIHLSWEARLLSKANDIKDGFSSTGPEGTIYSGPAPFGVESNHKYYFIPTTPDGKDGPEAWTMHAERKVKYDMEFQWSDCNSSPKRKFSPSPTLPAGAQRAIDGKGPAEGAEFYRASENTGF